MSLQEKAKLMMQPQKFFNQHNIALCAHTLISQKLPKQLEGVLSKFCEDAACFVRIGKYPFFLAGNMNETVAFFNMVP